MANGRPDEELLFEIVTSLKWVQKNNCKVQAFGEIVALLWQQGVNGATAEIYYKTPS